MAAQQDYTDRLREAYEAFNEQNFEAVFEVISEDVEWNEPEGWRFGGTYHSSDEVGSVFERAFSEIDDLQLATERFIDAGETVIVLGRLQGTTNETGTSLDVPFAHVHDIDDGQVTRFRQYIDTAQVEQALSG